jgi:Ca-activated chloride channel family protein
MRFLHPSIAWWFLVLAAVVLILRLLRRRRLGLATSSARIFEPAYRASLLRRSPLAVFALALVLLGAALMDPVLPFAQTQVRSHGLDIVIALDLSSSMGDRMGRNAAREGSGGGQPFKTRLDATKEAIRGLVARRIDDRIGLVVFSDNPYVISPLTFDHRYLVHYIDMVDDQILRGEGMTAIGEGLALANRLLSRQAAVPGARNKVVVIFTDGENNIGRDPLEVLGESDSAGIRVHLVGVDLEDEIKKKPPVQALVRAVTRYGGRYFNADTERQLDAASQAIDAIEKGVLVSQTYEHDAPVFDWFAVPSLLCLAIGFGLRAIPGFIDQT